MNTIVIHVFVFDQIVKNVLNSIVNLDHVNMVQSHLQTREGARSFGCKIPLIEICASGEQSVARPSVVVGESTAGLNKTGGHVCSLCGDDPQASSAHIEATVWARLRLDVGL